MARKIRSEDATVWIGYADFLTTLTVLFLVMVVMGAAGGTKSAFYVGIVHDSSATAIVGCAATVDSLHRDSTNAAGGFEIRVDSIRSRTTVGLTLECPRYGVVTRLVGLTPGDTTRDTLRLRADSTVGVASLPGDALFSPNEYILKPEAIGTISTLGRQLEQKLGGDVIAVQGHTDDVPFPAGAGKDNWMLSGERAAAAAKILTDSVGIPPCQVVIMGFGPSRPVEPIAPGDDASIRRRKRSQNRRIEFRQLRGTALGGTCAR